MGEAAVRAGILLHRESEVLGTESLLPITPHLILGGSIISGWWIGVEGRDKSGHRGLMPCFNSAPICGDNPSSKDPVGRTTA